LIDVSRPSKAIFSIQSNQVIIFPSAFQKRRLFFRRLATYLWSNTSSTSIDMAKYPKVTAFYADMNAGGQGTWMGKLPGVLYEISSRITYGKYGEKQTRSAGGFL
jgi:hypothetical protein